LGSITTNKASGGDGIRATLFQILRYDAVKVLHSICQQIWKTQQQCYDHSPREPDILECEVEWASGSITTNKARGPDGIPVELFQILKDDGLKVLQSICQKI